MSHIWLFSLLSNETVRAKNNEADNITLHHIFYCGQMKENETGGECIMHAVDNKFIQKFGLNHCRKITLEGSMLSYRIILKEIL